MNTKLFTGLALAAALLISQPAFAKDKRGGGGGGHHAVAAVHHGGGGHARIASRHTTVRSNFRTTRVARTNAGARTYAAANMGRTNRGRNTVAYGGSSRYSGGNNGGGNNHGSYAFASHSGWNHGQEYFWHGHHYQWYGNGWYIIDLTPFAAGYYPGNYGPGYNTDSMAVQVQQNLAHDGYYGGPIDGVIGPGTGNAIAAYQRDNGLPITGTINGPLLQSMGL